MQERQLKSAPVTSPKAVLIAKDHTPMVKKQNGLKKGLSIALVTLTLLGAAGLLITKNADHQENEVSQATKQYKAEFVKNALALSDDGYQSIDQYKNGDHQINGSIHEHEAATISAEVEREISSVSIENEAAEATDSAESLQTSTNQEDERLRAIESESLSLNISEQVESHNQAIRDELKLRKSEEESRYQFARAEALKKKAAEKSKALAEKSLKDARSRAHAQALRMTIKAPYLIAQNPKFESFKGALTKCHIKGHDIHWINDMGWILEHLKVDADLTPNVLAAREIIAEHGGGVVVVVYEKGYEAYDTQGNLVDKGNKE